MSEGSVADKVIELVAKVAKVEPFTVTPDSTFGGDLKTKSIHILQLIALLANEFGVQISMPEARRNETVGDVIAMIEAKSA